MKRIKDLPKIDRPREKLLAKGPQALSEFELLEVIIGNGSRTVTVEQLAVTVQKIVQTDFDKLTLESLTGINGFSTAKASQLVAAVEFAKRHIIEHDEPLLKTEDYVYSLGDIVTKSQEYLVCLSLDGARRLIARRVITIGTLDSVLIHPREVFADALSDRAAAIVVGHNHPSGDNSPSEFDIGFNQQLAAAACIVGIELVDHVIVTKRGYYSFKKEGLL